MAEHGGARMCGDLFGGAEAVTQAGSEEACQGQPRAMEGRGWH